MNQPNLPDFQPYGRKPCSTEIAGKPITEGYNIKPRYRWEQRR